MAFNLRQSKFRHVFGKPNKRDQCYDGIRITRTSWESTYCAANPKYVAVITEAAGGGSFLVLPLAKTGRVNIDHPTVAGHKGAVYDVAWCPHNDDIIASGADDCIVRIWQIPEGGLTDNLLDPLLELSYHEKRVTMVVWHPSAQNVLLSASSDNKIVIWNLEEGTVELEVSMPDQIFSGAFNEDGSRFVCTCKDKFVRIFDTHTGNILQEGKCHMGAKPSQCAYVKGGKIFTTGFSRMSERQFALWDENDLSKEITMQEIDSSNGVNFIFYDPDTNMIYLAGKGDSCIRYYEITDESPFIHFLSMYQSNSPQRGIGFMPKRALDVQHCEISRFYKLHNNGLCEVIPFFVPRKSELFQTDLYPDTASDEPAISASDFFSGKNAKPKTVSLSSGVTTTKKDHMKVVRRSGVPSQMPSKRVTEQSNNAEAAAAPALPPGFDPQGILDDMRKLKLIVKAHERRIKTLEEKLSQYESDEEHVEDA